MESHLEVTGGGLLLREVGLEATGSAVSPQALLCSQPQRVKWVWAALQVGRGLCSKARLTSVSKAYRLLIFKASESGHIE